MSNVLTLPMGDEKVVIGEYIVDRDAEKEAETLIETTHPHVMVLTTNLGKKQIPLQHLLLIEKKYRDEIKAAYQRGLEEGQTSGYEKGANDGREEARKVVASLTGLINDVTRQRQKLLSEAREHIFEMVIQVSKKLSFEAAALNPEITMSIIAGAIDQLLDKSKINVKVNPDHLPEIEQHIDRYRGRDTAIKEITFEADPRVRAGGCFIETPSGDVDARMESMFEIIRQSLLDGEGTTA
ncbi:MAG: hypothetical protein GY841_09805 [FCB group bacterium]|nr:hypothetical protein [FCB group bacterium]